MPDTREKITNLLCESNFMSYDKQADYLIANGVTFATGNNVGVNLSPSADNLYATEWIPVSERLPELETPVLISLRLQRDVFARVGWLHESGMWSVTTTKKWVSDAVTHWMPLPKPPKGE